MSKVRGMGGWIMLVAPGPVSLNPKILTQHNAIYTLVTRAELRQSRTPNAGGMTEGLPAYRTVESVEFKVADDDVFYPQAIGFTEGAEIPLLWLKRGELARYDMLVRTIVERIEVQNDQQKARWVTVTCRHGTVLRDARTDSEGVPVIPGGDYGGGGDFGDGGGGDTPPQGGGGGGTQ